MPVALLPGAPGAHVEFRLGLQQRPPFVPLLLSRMDPVSSCMCLCISHIQARISVHTPDDTTFTPPAHTYTRRPPSSTYVPANVVLEDTYERHYAEGKFGELELGLYIIRAENLVLLGEMVRGRDERGIREGRDKTCAPRCDAVDC